MTETCVNCGGAICLCAVVGTGLLSTTGSGTEADPILFHLSCADVVACVGEMMTDIGFTTGMLATGNAGERLEADTIAGHAVWVARTVEWIYATGADVDWVVPDGVTSLDALLWGGGYWGGMVFGVIPVTPGETLRIRVGMAAIGGTGAYPNGGDGGTGLGGHTGLGGCGGTDIYRGSTPLLIAGGEGGGTDTTVPSTRSGTEGGLGSSGGTGSSAGFPSVVLPTTTPNGSDAGAFSSDGQGGSQTAGGGLATGGSGGSAGVLDQGGNGRDGGAATWAPGGGGGGYYGGGGGGVSGLSGLPSGGGGGSCYMNATDTTGGFVIERFLDSTDTFVGNEITPSVPILTDSDVQTYPYVATVLYDIGPTVLADGVVGLRYW